MKIKTADNAKRIAEAIAQEERVLVRRRSRPVTVIVKDDHIEIQVSLLPDGRPAIQFSVDQVARIRRYGPGRITYSVKGATKKVSTWPSQ